MSSVREEIDHSCIQTAVTVNRPSSSSHEGNPMNLKQILPVPLVGLLALGVYGCSSPESDPVVSPASSASAAVDEHVDHDHGGHDAVDDDSPMAKMMPGLKELSSPEDYKSAMAQHICPVSGEMLGTMGAPEKVDVNGTSVWICCDGCKDKLLADPEKYLAKLNQK